MTFTKKGFVFTLFQRIAGVAIYERKHVDHSKPHWEVIKIQIVKAREIFGRMVEEHEAYPGDEEWGTNGWTCTTLDDAKAKAAVWRRSNVNTPDVQVNSTEMGGFTE